MCNTYLRFVQTTVRNSNKNLIVKIKEVYSEKKKNEFMKYFKSFRYSFKKYNKKTVISFILFRLNLEWLYRIACEPKRIKRFYDSNVKFMFKVRKYI